MAIEQWGFWRATPTVTQDISGPLKLASVAKRLTVEPSLPVLTTLVCCGQDSNTQSSACERSALTDLNQWVWLKLAQWFWRGSRKCEKFTDGGRQLVINEAHLSLRLLISTVLNHVGKLYMRWHCIFNANVMKRSAKRHFTFNYCICLHNFFAAFDTIILFKSQ